MAERKINIEKIIDKNADYHNMHGEPILNIDNIKNAMISFGNQLLELAAENANFKVRKYVTYFPDSISSYKIYTTRHESIKLDEESILDTIKQIE